MACLGWELCDDVFRGKIATSALPDPASSADETAEPDRDTVPAPSMVEAETIAPAFVVDVSGHVNIPARPGPAPACRVGELICGGSVGRGVVVWWVGERCWVEVEQHS